jgi:hypothetical protein
MKNYQVEKQEDLFPFEELSFGDQPPCHVFWKKPFDNLFRIGRMFENLSVGENPIFGHWNQSVIQNLRDTSTIDIFTKFNLQVEIKFNCNLHGVFIRCLDAFGLLVHHQDWEKYQPSAPGLFYQGIKRNVIIKYFI